MWRKVLFLAAATAVGLAGCSDPAPGAASVFDAGSGDGAAADAKAAETAAETSAETAAVADVATEVAPDVVADTADDSDDSVAQADVDWSELLDPPDAPIAGDAAEPTGPVGFLYAQTADELYKLDLAAKAFSFVGKWSYDKNAGSVTDIAVDQYGQLFAITHKDLFLCNVDTAKCKWLMAMPEQYYGMTLVPKGTVDPEKDAIIGISQTGDWVQIIATPTGAKLKKLGSFGSGWLCSGDAFSVEGVGTFATVKKATGNDSLAQVDPKTGKVLAVIGDTGVKNLFGLAWWAGVVYGFSSDGNVYELDTQTGKAVVAAGLASPKGAKWWGAGVSTRAAGKAK